MPAHLPTGNWAERARQHQFPFDTVVSHFQGILTESVTDGESEGRAA